MLNYRLFFLIASILVFSGCSDQEAQKELTQQEKNEITHKVESEKLSIADPVIALALSACQYHKAFANWPNANFVSTPQSDFNTFAILPTESDFYSEFKLKGSEFIFNLNIGLPGTKFENGKNTFQDNENQAETDSGKKKISEKLSKPMKDNSSNSQELLKSSGDCVFMLKAAHPSKPVKINLQGPIVLGKTWATDAERNKLASMLFLISTISGSLPIKHETSYLDKLLSNEITDAFIRVSLCNVLGIEPHSCR